MATKTISVEQLAMETGKIVRQARKSPVVVRSAGQPPLVLRPLGDDDLAEDLLLKSAAFRAGIRGARQRRRRDKGVSLAAARRQLKS